jgi:hypothetical protein
MRKFLGRRVETAHHLAVFGGIPFYLNLTDPDDDIETTILKLALETGAPLADEPENLLP